MRTFRALPLLLPLVALAASASISGCAGADDAPVATGTRQRTAAASDFGVHIRLRQGDKVSDVTVPPVGAGAAVAKKSREIGSRAQGVVEVPGLGPLPFDQDLGDTGGAWFLLSAAALNCGWQIDKLREGQFNSPVLGVLSVPPWKGSSEFIFATAAEVCDQRLLRAEALVCLGDTLASIADAVGQVEWQGKYLPPSTDPPIQIIVPPQASKDRFIARELATYVLAHVPYFDAELSPTLEGTCLDAYAAAGLNPSSLADPDLSSRLFAVTEGQHTFLPPSDPANPALGVVLNAANLPAILRSRFEAHTHIMRAGAAILHKQIESGFYEDMASGMDLRGRSTDPLRGARRLWGADPTTDGRFGSLQHALRFVAGRWELAPPSTGHEDPQCAAYPATNLVDALGDAFAARIDTLPTPSVLAGEADELFKHSGLIVDEGYWDGGGTTGALRAHLVTALTERAQAAGVTNPGVAGGLTEAITTKLAAVADGDLRFAASQSAKRARISSPTLGTGTVFVDPHIAKLPTSFPSSDLITDPIARSAGATTASQCSEPSNDQALLLAPPPPGIRRLGFQDAFSVGQEYMRRLVASQTAQLSLSEDHRSALRTTSAAASEIRTWAGPGRVALFATDASGSQTDGEPITSIQLALIGLRPEELGVETPADVAGSVSLVWGPPWAAECAAGLRQVCPVDFASQYVLSGGSFVSTPGNPISDGRATTGEFGTFALIEFPTTFPAQFNPSFGAPGSDFGKYLYVIQRLDPDHPERGKVLAALTPKTSPGIEGSAVAVATVSTLQRELLTSLFGVSASVVARSSETSTRALMQPASCIPGVKWDEFVPLENELTSDGDQFESSWRHYLSRARDAATKADQLGNDIIEQGLRQDERRERAQAELAEYCGDYLVAEQTSYPDDGKTKAPAGDAKAETCFGGGGRFDLLFFGPNPISGDTPTRVKKLMKGLQCLPAAQQGEHPLCAKVRAGKVGDEDIRVGGLGLVEVPSQDTAELKECGEVASDQRSLFTSFKGMNVTSKAQLDWAREDALKASAGRLGLVLESDLEWKLLLDKQPIMDTRPNPKLWPGCRWQAVPAKCGASVDGTPDGVPDDDRRRAEIFDALFLTPAETTAPTVAHRENIRWRLEGALWTLASLGGPVPGGLFVLPLPVANFDATFQSAPAYTIYSKSSLLPGPGGVFGLNESEAEIAAIGGQLASWFAGAPWGTEAPAWLADVAAAGGHMALTKPVSSFAEPGAAPANLSAWLGARMENFAGATCAGFNDASPPAVPAPGVGEVGVLKMPGQREWCMSTNSGSALTLARVADPPHRAAFYPSVKLTRGTPSGVAHDVMPRWGFSEERDKLIEGTVLYLTWLYLGSNVCDSGVGAVPMVSQACLQNPGPVMDLSVVLACSDPLHNNCEGREVATEAYRMLLPLTTPPSRRLKAFVNSGAPAGVCGAASQVVAGLTLGCVASRTPSGFASVGAPPPATSASDLGALGSWAAGAGARAKRDFANMYVTRIPVAATKPGSDPTNGLGGLHADQVLKIRQSLKDVARHWNAAAGAIEGIGNELVVAQMEIKQAKTGLEVDLAKIKVAKLQALLARLSSAEGFFSGLSNTAINGGFAGAAAYVAKEAITAKNAVDAASLYLSVESQTDATNKDFVAKVDVIFAKHNQSVAAQFVQFKDALTGLEIAVDELQKSGVALSSTEQKAQHAAAIATGQDSYIDETTGKEVPIPVNTALRRQYNVTQARYERALRDAKALSYLARLAIEQRIGIRLRDLKEDIGPLEAPDTWVDKVCGLTGIDYTKLRTPGSGTGGAAGAPSAAEENYHSQIITDFADQYVGDYVSRLESFVEFYNLKYPSHEGDDRAVLSLKDDLLPKPSTCFRPSKNLLVHSSDLSAKTPASSSAAAQGWDVAEIGAPEDPHALIASANNQVPVPAEVGNGGGTWLRDIAFEGGGLGPYDKSIVRTLGQTRTLSPGTYVLSWWDQARDADGGITGARVVQPYVALVAPVGGKENLLPEASFVPFNDGAAWSERHAVQFKVSVSGEYSIRFGSGFGAAPISVALANVQLEKITAPGSGATAYENTGDSLTVLTSDCSGRTKEELLAAFKHECSDGVCFYETIDPIPISTQNIKTTALKGKLADGNYNFRHIDLAVNLVGTAVHACADGAMDSCFGSGFLEYSLFHDAFSVPVTAHKGIASSFDFGQGVIEHGKALAAERYITTPLASSDAGLLSQPGVTKVELRGRPLDGTYKLRIYDGPQLNWGHLDDVQVVLTYRYWSRVEKLPGNDLGRS